MFRNSIIVFPIGLKGNSKYIIVGQICADLGPNCSLSVKSTKFSGNIGKNMGINM